MDRSTKLSLFLQAPIFKLHSLNKPVTKINLVENDGKGAQFDIPPVLKRHPTLCAVLIIGALTLTSTVMFITMGHLFLPIKIQLAIGFFALLLLITSFEYCLKSTRIQVSSKQIRVRTKRLILTTTKTYAREQVRKVNKRMTGSSQIGGKRTPHYTITVMLDDRNDGHIASDISDRLVADWMVAKINENLRPN